MSRVAKNFQDYFVNVIVQRLGAEMYSDGIRHSLELPYSVFEDQRSGETLGKLQKVRSDVEKFITLSINMLFTTLVGVVFVMIYAFSVHWVDCAGISAHYSAAWNAEFGPEQANQGHSEGNRRRNDGACRGRRQSRCATSSS